MPKTPLTFSVRTRVITDSLGIIILTLLAAHVLGRVLRFGFGHDYVGGFVPLFNLNDEHNFPTVYAFLSLIFSASLFFIIGLIIHKEKRAWSRHWFGLSAIFTFIALDEILELHERLDKPLRSLLGTSGIFYYAWVIPYAIAFFAIALAYSRFLIALPRPIALGMVTAGALFVGGALCVEALSALVAQRQGVMNFLYLSLTTCEEFLEMLGVFLLIQTLLKYLHLLDRQLSFQLSADERSREMLAPTDDRPDVTDLQTQIANSNSLARQ